MYIFGLHNIAITVLIFFVRIVLLASQVYHNNAVLMLEGVVCFLKYLQLFSVHVF